MHASIRTIRSPENASRRRFVNGIGKATLSATAVALLAGCESIAKDRMAHDPAKDASILNVALGLEHQAIAAYQLGAESGLLQKPVLGVAIKFQGQHKGHRDALAGAVRRLGGTPVEAKPTASYGPGLKVETLKTQNDVLMLAAGLEKGAANAYLGVIPSFSDPEIAKVAGRLAADETMHWVVLAQALNWPLPNDALTFGA